MVVQLNTKRRRLSAAAAEQTWSVRRFRPIPDLVTDEVDRLTRLFSEVTIIDDRIAYRDAVVRPRPSVTALLDILLPAAGQVIGIAEISRRVYGKPMSMRALRQIVFRVNRTFERIECPLVVHCRQGKIYVRLKVWSFARKPCSA